MICFFFVHEVYLPDLHFFNISCFKGPIKHTHEKATNCEEAQKKKKLVKNDQCQAEACLCQISFST